MRCEVIRSFCLPPTLNDIVNTARTNRYASADAKAYWTKEMKDLFLGIKPFLVQESKLKSERHQRIWIEWVWHVKNFGRDEDNISAAQKYVLDGMVAAGVVDNDNLRVIQEPVTHWFRKDRYDGFDLFIYDYDGWLRRCRDRLYAFASGEDESPAIP